MSHVSEDHRGNEQVIDKYKSGHFEVALTRSHSFVSVHHKTISCHMKTQRCHPGREGYVRGVDSLVHTQCFKGYIDLSLICSVLFVPHCLGANLSSLSLPALVFVVVM